MPAGDSMPDTYIAIMLQSLKKKEQVLDEIIRLDDRQKDTLMDPECPFDVFDETVEAKSACIDQLNQLDSGFEKLLQKEDKKMSVTLNPDKEVVNTIREGLKRTGGYCPCRLQRTEENKCMCKEFRDQIADPNFEGFCHCMLYYKSLKD